MCLETWGGDDEGSAARGTSKSSVSAFGPAVGIKQVQVMKNLRLHNRSETNLESLITTSFRPGWCRAFRRSSCPELSRAVPVGKKKVLCRTRETDYHEAWETIQIRGLYSVLSDRVRRT